MAFLLVHLSINLFLFVGKEAFNQASYFMSHNPFIQGMQWVLVAGFILHIYLGIKLHLQNKKARGKIPYAINKYKAHTPFNSRTMLYTGLLTLCFLILHLSDFTLPIKTNQMRGMDDYELVTSLFRSPFYSLIYVFSFIILAIHLSHGIKASFSSMGVSPRSYMHWLKPLGIAYFWFISLGFSAIAIWFFLKGNFCFNP